MIIVLLLFQGATLVASNYYDHKGKNYLGGHDSNPMTENFNRLIREQKKRDEVYAIEAAKRKKAEDLRQVEENKQLCQALKKKVMNLREAIRLFPDGKRTLEQLNLLLKERRFTYEILRYSDASEDEKASCEKEILKLEDQIELLMQARSEEQEVERPSLGQRQDSGFAAARKKRERRVTFENSITHLP